eukprot:1158792-Pelagomonas_calceolata.AAC.9
MKMNRGKCNAPCSVFCSCQQVRGEWKNGQSKHCVMCVPHLLLETLRDGKSKAHPCSRVAQHKALLLCSSDCAGQGLRLASAQ